ncbi:hypothetical protein Halhy_3232 [Haliscomenobacter hydrossis DSM 1100]|uniref:Uncharacterized protein n=2 Tax=Haliscomenobacter TaxID=2349 RepID=F4KS05_HALH1|nr:hypothetical protein Halhy_3232 [Haliscomenobacter hydrossis DSM 1100]
MLILRIVLNNKKMKTEQALAMIKNGESLKGVVLEDLDAVQVSARDALSLARSGIVIPEQNVFYDDADIAYDEEIDEVEWSNENLNLSWEEKAKLFSQNKYKPITLEITTNDLEVDTWLRENQERLSEVIKPIVKSLFEAEKMIKVK